MAEGKRQICTDDIQFPGRYLWMTAGLRRKDQQSLLLRTEACKPSFEIRLQVPLFVFPDR